MNSLQAYELLRFSQQFLGRLKQVQADPAYKRGLAHEKEWLSSAAGLLEQFQPETKAVLDQAFALPELEEARADLANERRGQWVETLERLLAGFTFHSSRRAPVVEALFPHQKLEPLARREDAAREYASEFERRLNSGYVVRMLAQEEFAFARPVLEELRSAASRWQSCDKPAPLEGHGADLAREQLAALSEKVQLALRQAKLLSEAALAALPNAFRDAGLDAKPRKRSPVAEPIPSEPKSEPETKAPPRRARAHSNGAKPKAEASPKV